MASNQTLSVNALITALPGIGPTFTTKLSHLKLASIRDLLHHYPSRFLDYRKQTTIRQIRPKTDVSFLAALGEAKRFNTKSGKSVTTVRAQDQTGKINLTWFNNPYIGRLIKPGEKYLVAGKAAFFFDKITLIAPTIEPANDQSLHTHGLVPIYPLTAGVSSRFLRQKIKLALDKTAITDTLNNQILNKLGLLGYRDSLHSIHFPKETAAHLAADKRLAFNHHLLLNITNLAEIRKLPPSPSLIVDRVLHRHLIESLPFKLTTGQVKAIESSYQDLTRSSFTHRLIQGETGSGKTVIVFFLAAQALARPTLPNFFNVRSAKKTGYPGQRKEAAKADPATTNHLHRHPRPPDPTTTKPAFPPGRLGHRRTAQIWGPTARRIINPKTDTPSNQPDRHANSPYPRPWSFWRGRHQQSLR